MALQRDGCPLTHANIIANVDKDVETVVDIVQEIIDDPEYDVPVRCVTKDDVAFVQELMAYYGNWHPTLLGFWGKVRVKAGTDKNRIAARDYLENATSACYKKYQAASRTLTNFQESHYGDKTRVF